MVTAVVGIATAEAPPAPRPLRDSAPVFIDDLLVTGPASRLAMRLGTSTSVRLGASAKLRIDRYIVNQGGELNLENGQILFDSADGKYPKGLMVRSDYALIAVRGTRFWGGMLDDDFAVFVAHGVVTVTAGGKSVPLGPGDGTTISHPGDPPEAVHRWPQAKIARALALVT